MAAAIPLISTGISALGSLFGAKESSNANTDAAHLQDDASKRSLNFLKQQYADVSGRLKPYVDAGTTASQSAQQLLGQSPYLAALRPQQAQTPMVTLRAPDGSTKQFANTDPRIALALNKGATRLDAPPQGAV